MFRANILQISKTLLSGQYLFRTSQYRSFIFKARKKMQEDKEKLEALNKEANIKLFEESQNKHLDAAKKGKKNRATFYDAIEIYKSRYGRSGKGSVEFIYSAMDMMKEYDVHKDLKTYKELLRIFPEGKLVPKSMMQNEMVYYPKHQECIQKMLQVMALNRVVPDDEFGRMILYRFGLESQVTADYQRLMYWMPKLKNANPWPIPDALPTDARQLAVMALRRISHDPLANITLFEVGDDTSDSIEGTFVASSQSKEQQELLEKYCRHTETSSHPLVVEVTGPHRFWFDHMELFYFILQREPNTSLLRNYRDWLKHDEETAYEVNEDTFNWRTYFGPDDEQSNVPMVEPSLHEQEDRTIFALCLVGIQNESLLKAWVSCLQDNNPALSKLTVHFKFNQPLGDDFILSPPQRKASGGDSH